MNFTRPFAVLRANQLQIIYEDKYLIVVEKAAGLLSMGRDTNKKTAQGLLTDRYLNGIPEDSRIAHGGHLKKEALTEKRLQQIKALNEIALRRGQTLAEMALSWILKDDYVTSVIIGSSSVGQLQKNLKALNGAPFSTEELQEIGSVCNE